MNESYVRRRLIKALNDLGADAIPVENIVASGMPDVNFCYQGQESWVEIKVSSAAGPGNECVKSPSFYTRTATVSGPSEACRGQRLDATGGGE